MPRSIFDRLGVGELKPRRMTLQLANSSVRLPLGIVEDVPVQVGKFYVPGDFVVMEMEEDKEVPIILGRSFLRTAGALIDVKNGTLTLNIGDEKVHFHIDRAIKYPAQTEACFMVDVIDELVEENFLEQVNSSLRCHPDYLSELQEKKIAREKVLATDAKSDPLEDLTHGPHAFHTVRAPQSDELKIAHGAHRAHTEEVHGPCPSPDRTTTS